MKKFIIIFSFLMLIITNFTIISTSELLDIAGNPLGDNKTSFDDVPAGSTDIVSGFVFIDDTSTGGGEFETSTNGDYSPDNSLKIYDVSSPYAASGYLNLTQTFDYVSQINFTFYITSTSSVHHRIYDSDGHQLMYLHYDTNSFNRIGWYDDMGWEYLSPIGDNNRYFITINHTGTNIFDVVLWNSTFGIVDKLDNVAGSYPETWVTFSNMKFDLGSGTSSAVYFDNFIIDYEDYDPSEDVRQIFCTYNIPESSHSLLTGYKFLETQYELATGEGLSGTLHEIRLYIDSVQYAHSSTLSDYDVVLNGNNLGSPDNFISIDEGDCDYYILWDNLSINLLNNEPVLSFASYQAVGSTYWVGFGVDEDKSIHGFGLCSADVDHNNSVVDFQSWRNYDLAYCLVFDEVNITPPDEPPNGTSSEQTIYFKFFNQADATGNVLRYKSPDISESLMMNWDYVSMYITSDVTGTISGYSLTEKFAVTCNFTSGQNVVFYFSDVGFTNFYGRIDEIFIEFQATSKTVTLYAGSTYAVYLQPIDYVDGVSYINCGHSYPNMYENNKAYLCINKVLYNWGETIRGEYKLPDVTWLDNHGFSTKIGSYILKVYNRDDYLILLGRRSAVHEAPRVYEWSIPASHFDNNRHTFEIPIQVYNSYGFDDGEYNDYEMVIDTVSWEYFKINDLIEDLIFYVTPIDFEPLGNITDMTPNPCYSGQVVDIAFTSNNIGWLEIREPDGNSILFSQRFGYSEALHVIPWSCSWEGAGVLPVYLYTEGPDYNHVDTELLIVNSSDLNETFGWRGFGIPYLYIPERQGNYIAGNSTVYIHYRTYKNNSVIIIKSPRKEQTYYSTTVSNQSRNHLAIKLDSWMQLGTWNVTFYCGDIYGENVTLYTEFNVVNEEGNWIEFTKHTYTTDELFQLYIKNSYRVSITFYKNDVATGESIIYNANEPDYKIIIPYSIVKPEIGHWRVEMWRINDRNIVYELAEWECDVIKGVASDVIKQEFGIEIPDWAKLIIGFFLVLMMTIAPILMIVLINKKSRRAINLPVLVYVGFFYFGLAISILLGFIPIEIIFVILFGTILAFLVLFLTGNLNKITGG